MAVTFASGASMTTDGQWQPPAPAVPETLTPTPDPSAPAADPSAAPSTPAGDQPAPSPDTSPPVPSEPTEGEESEETLVLPPTNRGQRRFVSNLIRSNAQLEQQAKALADQNALLTRLLNQQATPGQQPQGQPDGQGEGQPVQAQPAAPQGRPLRPDPNAFVSNQAYLDAYDAYTMHLAQWTTEQTLTQREARQAQETAQHQWARREQEGRQHHPDFDTTVGALAFAPQVQGVIADTFRNHAAGPEVLYYLGKHPDELARLNQAPSALDVALILADVHRQVATTVPPRTPAPRTPTPAAPVTLPAPMQPVGGGSVPGPVLEFRPGMPLSDFERRWNQQHQGGRR